MLPTLYAVFLVAISSNFVRNFYSQAENCGKVRKASRKNTAEGDWPWMVAIINERKNEYNEHWCNGFLIDRRHVLTAAQCFVEDYKLDDFTTRIGKKNWEEGEEYKITCITIHPRYDSTQVYDDIAILTLSRDVDTPNYTPICLPDDNLRTKRLYGLAVTGAAWGDDYRRRPSKTLMQFTGLRIISNKECNKFLSENIGNGSRTKIPGAVSNDMLCTINLSDQWEPCGGSSGAPLMYKDDRNKWIAVGITAYGFACRKGTPSINVKVSEYVEWIMENTRGRKGECSLATGYETENRYVRECLVLPEECRGIPIC